MNKYQELLDIHLKTLNELNKYQQQCVSVVLNGSTANVELRLLHKLISEHFPELISHHRISDGGSNKMTLTAKVEEIKPALELLLSEYSHIRYSLTGYSLKRVINELEPNTTIKLFPDYR